MKKLEWLLLAFVLLGFVTLGNSSDVERSPSVTTRKNSAGSDFTRKRLNVIEGTGVTVTMSDDSANNEIDLTVNSTGGGGGGAVVETIFDTAQSSPTLTLIGNANQMSGSVSGSTMTFSLKSSSVTLQANVIGGDVTGTLAALVVGDDSHAHTSTSLSGIDISADTNLAATHPVILTGDTLSLDHTLTSSLTITAAGGLGVTYGLTAGSLTVTAGMPHSFTYKAGVCQGSTASLGFSHYTSSGPTALCMASTSTIVGVASFIESSSGTVQDHFRLPTTWTGAISADIVWVSTATSNDVVWQVRTACVADAELGNPTFNTANTVTDTAKGTANQYNTTSIASLTTTGCASDEDFFFEFFRQPGHASDTLASTANLVSLRFTVRSTQ
jgi:hypothetical protein